MDYYPLLTWRGPEVSEATSLLFCIPTAGAMITIGELIPIGVIALLILVCRYWVLLHAIQPKKKTPHTLDTPRVINTVSTFTATAVVITTNMTQVWYSLSLAATHSLSGSDQLPHTAIIRKHSATFGNVWDTYLYGILYAYRNTSQGRSLYF